MLPASLSETQVAQVARAMMPVREQDWPETDLKGFMLLARKAAEAVVCLGSPIPPFADVETLFVSLPTLYDNLKDFGRAQVFPVSLRSANGTDIELVRRADMEAQIAQKDDQIAGLRKKLSAKTGHYVEVRNDRDAAKGKIGALEEAVNSLTQECDALKKEIARLQKLALPAEMSPDIAAALGIICFQAVPFAAAFRSVGENVPRKAEAEQAFVIFRLLKAVLAGGNFDQAWRALVEDALAAQERAEKDRFGGGMS
ncbi:TMF family protein [Gluconacetobacter entanii]|uniref:TMF family protein n=1 Tax=Gluconacetobacter entanii TaxID=108528 RepID=A0ABT3K2F8_9PROT|nr:TMF family protein [Gluconacetobacter entanii]MCW4589590.1 TMF family protein [Gluconacetobacter entanii]MCW4593016.1 TMF family protein [Gluconacetobacter entanii]NPC89204.1 TMF family protein [Gluconacetobacter entanii]